MKDRILKILQEESLTSAKFADEIGVQRSSISHLISGRNKPSVDFIQKLLSRYRYLNAEWLLTGKGEMYKDSKPIIQSRISEFDPIETTDNTISDESYDISSVNDKAIPEVKRPIIKEVERIVIFYSDGSFKEYLP